MSSRPSTAAPPRVPSRSASRTVIAVGPAAAARDEQRLLDLEEEVGALVRRRAVDAEPDRRARVDELAHRRDPGAEAQVRGRAVRDPDAGRPNAATSAPERWTQCAHQTSPAIQPSSRGTRPAGSRTARGSTASSSTVSARCVCSFSPSRRASAADSAISSFVTENGEQGATASCTIPSASWSPASRSVSARMSSIDSTSESGGRPPSRLAEVHRAARGDDPHAELSGRLHLRLPEPGPAAREDVVVVEDRRAAGQRELGEPGPRGRVLGLGVDPRPDRVELAQPLEERRLLGPGARERLVQVVVRVDEARRDDRSAQVDDRRRPPAARRPRPPRRARRARAPSRPGARRRNRPSARSSRFAGASSSPRPTIPRRRWNSRSRLHIVGPRAFHCIGEEFMKNRRFMLGALVACLALDCSAGGVAGVGEAGQGDSKAFKVAWIYPGPYNDGGWSSAHDAGRHVRREGARRQDPDHLQGQGVLERAGSGRWSPASSATATR